MSVFFPPDVRVRIDGEPGDARPYLGRSRDVLFKALNMQAAGQSLPIKLTQRLDDNAYVQVLLTGNQKIVFISAGAPAPEVTELPPEPPIPEIPTEPFFDMLSGWVAPGNITTGTNTANGTTFKQLENYKPTHDTAIENQFKEIYAKIKRLAVPGLAPVVLNPSPALFQGSLLKSSMYSGSMKEIIQALMGLGIIADASRDYINNDLPSPMKRPIQVKYDYKWGRTHGVIKAADKNWWLVEISVTNGVLAMPLPLLQTTTTKAYHARLKARKAVESLAVVDKYGGLPSGEPFPAGVALTAAITAGKVLRLMLPADLTDFHTKNPYASQMGWAFAETDQKADNTCWWLDATVGVKVSYHYGIDFALSPWDLHNLTLGFPVGTGSATLKLRQQGYLGGPLDTSALIEIAPLRIWEESLGTLDLFDFTVQASVPNSAGFTSDTVMFVYYRGNELECLNYFYPQTTTDQIVTDHLSTVTRRVLAQFYGTTLDKREWSYLGSTDWRNDTTFDVNFEFLGEFSFGLGDDPVQAWLTRSTLDRLQRLTRRQFGGAVIPQFLREGYVINVFKQDFGFERDLQMSMAPIEQGGPGGPTVFVIADTWFTAPFWVYSTGQHQSTESFESLDYFIMVGNYGFIVGNSLREDLFFDRHTGGDAFTSVGPISGEFTDAITLPLVSTSYTQVAPPVAGYPPEAAWNDFNNPLKHFYMSADFNAGPNKGFILESRAILTAVTPDLVTDYVRRGPNLDGFRPPDMSWIGRV